MLQTRRAPTFRPAVLARIGGIAGLFVLLSACWTGPFADYAVEGQVAATYTVPAGTTLWLGVDGVHQATFTEVDEASTNARPIDDGFASIEVVARGGGTTPLHAEVLYYRCEADWTQSPPRQAGEAELLDGDVALIEHGIDFFGAATVRESGSPMNCVPGSEPYRALGIGLTAPPDADVAIDLDIVVELTRSYPDKYWDASKGTLDLTLVQTTAAELGRVVTP